MKTSAMFVAVGLLATLAASAIAQTTDRAAPPGRSDAAKQRTDGDGPPMIGPGSGAYKQYSDPQGWDKDAQAWHKQHTAGTDAGDPLAKNTPPSR